MDFEPEFGDEIIRDTESQKLHKIIVNPSKKIGETKHKPKIQPQPSKFAIL